MRIVSEDQLKRQDENGFCDGAMWFFAGILTWLALRVIWTGKY